MTKKCHQCGSADLKAIEVKLAVGRDKATQIYTSGNASLCLQCGFAEYLNPQAVLAQLQQRSTATDAPPISRPEQTDRCDATIGAFKQ